MSRGETSASQAELTAGYARAHQLELEALRLERVGDHLLACGGTPVAISETLAQRRAVANELRALRRQLDSHRGAG